MNKNREITDIIANFINVSIYYAGPAEPAYALHIKIQCRSRSVGILKKPIDLDLVSLLFSM